MEAMSSHNYLGLTPRKPVSKPKNIVTSKKEAPPLRTLAFHYCNQILDTLNSWFYLFLIFAFIYLQVRDTETERENE